MTRVLVIGSGVAGLSAAVALEKRKIAYDILEATDWIGGRVKQATIGGRVVDIGAKFITGYQGNPITPYFVDTRLSQTDSGSYLVFDSDGQEIKVGDLDLTTLLEDVSLRRQRAQRGDITVGTALALVAPMKQLAEPIREVLSYYCTDYEFSDTPDNTSLFQTHPLPSTTVFSNEFFFTNGSSNDLVKGLADQIPKDRIKLNHPVRVLEQLEGTYRVQTANGKDRNELVGYTHVICTASLGVLQSGLIQFIPPLPREKTDDILKFRMCSDVTMFIQFDKVWWPDTEFFLYADKRRGYYPVWMNLSLEKYYGSHSCLLSCSVSGYEARRLERMSDEETTAELLAVARKIFKEPRLKILDVCVPRWTSDPFFRGVYSNWPLGFSNEDFKVLKKPVHNLLFAGEHTSEHFNGYLQGAFLSGIEAVEAIVAQGEKTRYSRKTKPV